MLGSRACGQIYATAETHPTPCAGPAPGSILAWMDEARESPHQTIAKFLADYPLFSIFSLPLDPPLPASTIGFWPESVRRLCKTCGVETNWRAEEPAVVKGRDALNFECLQCFTERFLVVVELWPVTEVDVPCGTFHTSGWSEVAFRKIGQWPAPSIVVDPVVASSLSSDDEKLYRRALLTLSQGFGLGAVAYLRRVVENQTLSLLDELDKLAEEEGNEQRLAEIATARAQHTASERLRLASEAVPASLKVGGHNPVALLYAAFSKELHGGSEEECVAVAQRLRAVFELVCRTIASHREAHAELAKLLT